MGLNIWLTDLSASTFRPCSGLGRKRKSTAWGWILELHYGSLHQSQAGRLIS